MKDGRSLTWNSAASSDLVYRVWSTRNHFPTDNEAAMKLLFFVLNRKEWKMPPREGTVQGHSEAAGGGLWRSRRAHWTSCFRDVTPSRFSPRTVCSMS